MNKNARSKKCSQLVCQALKLKFLQRFAVRFSPVPAVLLLTFKINTEFYDKLEKL